MNEPACFRPASLAEALERLAAVPDARALAGGQTLVAMLNLGLVEPAGLVSLANVAELRGIARTPQGGLRVGAMTTHAEIAASPLCAGGFALLGDAARQIADPAIRNAGTIGGACAHGDPASDWPSALVAAGATLELQSTRGRRALAAGAFFLDLLTTALEPGELVVAIDVPPLAGQGRYRKLARVHGDYATASVALVLDLEGERVRSVRLAVGACGPRPVRLADAEAMLVGERLDRALAERCGARYAAAIDPIDDVRGSARYRRRVVPVLVADALMEGLVA
jgi:aerobic carbon-monoxide dehydrogenase medium subunit